MDVNTSIGEVKSEFNDVINSLALSNPDLNLSSDHQGNCPENEFITSEQESYVKGFDEALQNIHLKEQFHLSEPVPNNCGVQVNCFNSQYYKQSMHPHPHGTYEPAGPIYPDKNSISRSKSLGYFGPYGEDLKPFSDPLSLYPNYDALSTISPFHFVTDMEEQEHLKRERKRVRNRLAASKCRKKRLEREARLEEDVKTKEDDFVDLKTKRVTLEKEVLELKHTLQSHHLEGCNV